VRVTYTLCYAYRPLVISLIHRVDTLTSYVGAPLFLAWLTYFTWTHHLRFHHLGFVSGMEFIIPSALLWHFMLYLFVMLWVPKGMVPTHTLGACYKL
jgi:hypothetical protein